MNPVAEFERFGVIMNPEPGDPTEAWGVLNPAIARGRDGELYLFARVVAEGNYSRIRMARVQFDEAGRPVDLERLGFVLEPFETYEMNGAEGGCEDPRITFIPAIDQYVMAYTGFGPTGPRIALAVSDDLFSWRRLGAVHFENENGIDFDGFDNKDAFFFPEPVIGPDGAQSLACVHRPMTGIDQDGRIAHQLKELPASIWVSYVPLEAAIADTGALLNLSQHQLLIRPEYGWENVKIGGGPPPVLTPCGWLLIHHGIENLSAVDEPRRLRYSAGAFLVDRWDVRRVLWRSSEPVLSPNTEQECFGVVNNVVFPTGVDRLSDHLVDVYYGMADARIGVARMRLDPRVCEDGFTEAA
ncbi:MAG TPA: glycosidase [Chloroflexota bacterium]|nr:glycosidase [Chloroflexota bacterium]